MTSPAANNPSWLRWLAVPAALLIISLAALAISTESRADFIDRVELEQAQRESEIRTPPADIPIDPSRIIIDTPNGSIELSLDGERVSAVDGDGEASVLTLTPDPEGDIVGFRVAEDGSIEPVRVGESLDGATLVVPNEDGSVTLVRPDGSLVVITPTADGVQAREWSADGRTSRLLEPTPEGTLDLGNELFATEGPELDPDSSLGSDSTADSGSSSDSGPDWQLIGILVLAAIGLAGAVWWFFYFRPRSQPDADPEPIAAPAWSEPGLDPWDAFETYLNGLLADPDPTHAIRLAFAYAERGIGRLDGRHPEETPYEWYSRIAPTEPDLAVLLWPLSERYSSIRFGRHEATSNERDEAVAELRSLAYTSCGAVPAVSGSGQ